ncbi:MAG: serine/threonine-protein kinase [Actinomycetota bacterium]
MKAGRARTAPIARSERWGFAEGEEIVPGLLAMRLLGSSRIHEVYVAWDEEMLGVVAVKLLQPRFVDDALTRAALAREGEALGALQHPSLPRCFASAVDGDLPHLVLELIEGPRLSTLIRRQRLLGVEHVIPLALQLCSGIHYMAGREMVHLDVKPKNVIMAPPPRLIDLSIARTIERARSVKGPIGTDRYMAPEQCGVGHEEEIGPATDVWGVGATLYESLSGRAAFPEGDSGAVGERRFPQLIEEPGPLPRHVPEPFVSIVSASLEKRPQDRPTAAEIVRTLDPIAEITPPRTRMGRVRVSAWRATTG